MKSCGCRSIIVALNKMDLVVGGDAEKEKRYTDYVDYFAGRLKYIGFSPENSYFLPVSGNYTF